MMMKNSLLIIVLDV